MSSIVFAGVSKEYGATRALQNIQLSLPSGKIYGLLGRNGAGKTTLLNLLTNRIFPSQGVVTLDGQPVLENDQALGQIFYMTEPNLYPASMRAKEVLRWTREFYPQLDQGYAQGLAAKFGLDLNKRVRELSTGYGSIFKATLALASNAPIVIYDEPVLGLDANHRELFYAELLANYAAHPKTVIISTHLIEEVAEVLEEVIIIKSGQIILQQPVEELLAGAYTVAGEANAVDRYVAARRWLAGQQLARFKSVTVLEPLAPADRELASELGLDLAPVVLQKLFIALTNA